jgi:hypothetical protein
MNKLHIAMGLSHKHFYRFHHLKHHHVAHHHGGAAQKRLTDEEMKERGLGAKPRMALKFKM